VLIGFALLLSGFLGLGLVDAHWETILNSITPPIPILLTHGCDDLSARLFEYSVRSYANVQNVGGEGDIVLTAKVTEGPNAWTKSKRVHMAADETVKLELVFDEVSANGIPNECFIGVRAPGVRAALLRKMLGER
jgi:hypothetical protein